MTKDDEATIFEFRIWGKYPKVRSLIRKLADSETSEEVDDCYLIVEDSTYNVKVRDDMLKVKKLVAKEKGFEAWTSQVHQRANSVPAPFKSIYKTLDLDRVRSKDRFTLEDALKKLNSKDGVRVVLAKKKRSRYTLGELTAEVTDIEVHKKKEVIRTICIEGDNLRDLVKLRKTLGIKGETNVAVHQFIDDKFGG